MPEPRDIPLFRWGEELRRRRHGRRLTRLTLLITAAAASSVTALIGTLLWPQRPLLVWNRSASSPLGIYQVTGPEDLRAGDWAVAWAPHAARSLAGERGYLPANVPLVKQVGAAGGDVVCAVGETIFVNGEPAALRQNRDPAGRALPAWTGCETLADGDIFLLTPGQAQAFDGRYFGVTRAQEVVGEARLLWAR
jgi:conjugative transfer signal peptidase TraF